MGNTEDKRKKVNDVTKTKSDELWDIVQDNSFGLLKKLTSFKKNVEAF